MGLLAPPETLLTLANTMRLLKHPYDESHSEEHSSLQPVGNDSSAESKSPDTEDNIACNQRCQYFLFFLMERDRRNSLTRR